MTRQIKFRARTLKYDPMTMPEWAEGFYYQELYQGKMRHLITDGAHTFEVDEKTLGQFTGLLDCKKREIYEGDIVRTDVGACNFADGAAGEVTFLRIVDYNDNAAFEPFSEFKYEHYDWEVIGNIHDRIITYDGKKYTAKVLPYKKGEDYCAKCPLDPDKCRLGFGFNVCEIFDCLQNEDTIQVLEEVNTNPELLEEGEK